MGKALFGTHAVPSSFELMDEVRSLRQRVAELEAALEAAEAARADANERQNADERAPATT